MNLEEFYGVGVDKPYFAGTMSVNNGFVQYLYKNLNSLLSAGNLPVINLGTTISKMQGSGIEKQPFNILDVPSSFEGAKYKTLGEELIAYRAKQYELELNKLPQCSRSVLLADYLLKTCICYVETFNSAGIPTKTYATRNAGLIKFLATLPEDTPTYDLVSLPLTKGSNDIDTLMNKTKSHTRPLTTDEIQKGELYYVRLDKKKSGYSVVMPRVRLCLASENVRIVPVFFNFVLVQLLWQAFQAGIWQVTYLKDNMIQRTLTTSLNPQILTKVYGDSAKVGDLLSRSNFNFLHRGYVTVPELYLPRRDETGCRALNLRILEIKPVNAATFVNPYLDIDLDGVATVFKSFVDKYTNNIDILRILKKLIDSKFGKLVGVTDPALIARYDADLMQQSNYQIVTDLNSWLDVQVMVDKTQVSRALHTCMISNPMLFPRYTGKYLTSDSLDTPESNSNWAAFSG